MGCSIILCVVKMGSATKTIKIAKKYGISNGTIYYGMGTINSRLLGILGLNEIRKEIVVMAADDEVVGKAIKGLNSEMEFHKPHHGIAFSIPISEFIGNHYTYTKSPENGEVNKTMYNIIYVVVPKGRAEDVIEAANKAGARGGTIINARGAGVGEVETTLFSTEFEPEQEKVFIITKSEFKDGIVKSIRSSMKIDEPGNGILFVTDIKEVYGLHED